MAAKGGPKTGGRKRGTPNRRTYTLMDKCEELKADPFEFLLNVVKGDWKSLGYESKERISGYSHSGEPQYEDVIRLQDRVKAATEACQYIHAKRKALEHSGLTDPKVVNEIEKLSELDSDELRAVIKEELKASA